MTDDETIATAMLMGFELRPVGPTIDGVRDTPGYRWNSGTMYGQWLPPTTPAKAEAARQYIRVQRALIRAAAAARSL